MEMLDFEGGHVSSYATHQPPTSVYCHLPTPTLLPTNKSIVSRPPHLLATSYASYMAGEEVRITRQRRGFRCEHE